MATVFKRPGSPFWFACYADQNGKTVRRTTKAGDKTTATRMALEWEELERAAKEGRATATTFQKVVSDISKRAIGEGLYSQTTREYLTDWLVSIRKKTNAMISYDQKKTGKKVVLPVHRDLLQHLHALNRGRVDRFEGEDLQASPLVPRRNGW